MPLISTTLSTRLIPNLALRICLNFPSFVGLFRGIIFSLHWHGLQPRILISVSDNRFRHFRNDLYLGDDPISTTPASERGEKAKERLRARKRINELKKRRKAKERKQRLKQTGEKSPSESPLARAALNETIMSRLDLSCFMKARRKGFAKAPPLENAYPAKYARFVSLFLFYLCLCPSFFLPFFLSLPLSLLEYREEADVYYVSIISQVYLCFRVPRYVYVVSYTLYFCWFSSIRLIARDHRVDFWGDRRNCSWCLVLLGIDFFFCKILYVSWLDRVTFNQCILILLLYLQF